MSERSHDQSQADEAKPDAVDRPAPHLGVTEAAQHEPFPESVPPPIPALAAIAIRFCGTCGTPWQSQWESCETCVARAAATSTFGSSADVARAYLGDKRMIVSAVALYFSLLAISAVAMLVLTVSDTEEMPLAMELTVSVLMSIVTLAWCAANWTQVLPYLRKFVNPGWFIAAPICAVGTYLIATFAVEGLVYLFHIDRIQYLDTYTKAGYGIWLGVLLVAVQPGIIEELAFRGVILTSLQRVLGNTEALVVSALMFAILHLSIPSIPHLFLMGVVLGLFRLRSGSVLPGMLLHFTHNLLVVFTEQHGSIFSW